MAENSWIFWTRDLPGLIISSSITLGYSEMSLLSISFGSVPLFKGLAPKDLTWDEIVCFKWFELGLTKPLSLVRIGDLYTYRGAESSLGTGVSGLEAMPSSWWFELMFSEPFASISINSSVLSYFNFNIFFSCDPNSITESTRSVWRIPPSLTFIMSSLGS